MAKSIEPKAEKKYKIYPFNPNFISDEKGYRLGLSPNEIDRLHVFRKKGKWVNSKTDFQRVTQVSDSMLNAISPYFKFPDWVIERRARTQNIKRKNEKSTKSPFTEKRDLNLANREELMKVSGIGEAFADRIIKLRRKFKKFDSIIQIKDVYGIPPETEKNIMAAFYVKKGAFEKVNINKASVAEITENRYIDYELARKIVLYRRLHERIENFEELGSIEGFPSYRKDRLKIYFTLN
jgi:DNA uptake protein ComE-like DNA-binding protein